MKWLDVTEPEPLPADESGTLARHFLANFQRYLAGTPLLDRIM